MTSDETRARGRGAFAAQHWADAFATLSFADRDGSLTLEDIERLAVAAELLGKHSVSEDAWARAYRDCVRLGDGARAARCAFWLAFGLLNRDEMASASGWLSRAQHALDAEGLDCVERGYLLLPSAIERFGDDDRAAHADFCEAAAIGAKFGDIDLVALADHGRGRTLIRLGKVVEGLAVLDAVMISVTRAEVSPLVIGDVYCGVIDECHRMFDVHRAKEWTEALSRWCDSQSDLVPYRGECLVYRAQIMHLNGAWQDAFDESYRACERLSRPPNDATLGAALYQCAEVHRLRGEFDSADQAYERASRLGRRTDPGLALLRLAQGRDDSAAAMIRRALNETATGITRAVLLPAYVEIMLAAADVNSAELGASELAELAAGRPPFLAAVSDQATGSVLLAKGQAQTALPLLRRAWAAWKGLDAPYEAARVRVLIGISCRDLRDDDAAEMEFRAAALVFESLGAAPDLARLRSPSAGGGPATNDGLTERELQVLRLVAAGKTNRAIGDDLVISEKTVARHMSNIFTKLGLSSRAAATAYAYKHGVV